ncbi:MAG: hypothetical protein NC093_11690, partial [Alistipes sp.]|nr:hypothetical protein [Alistipes sp.]
YYLHGERLMTFDHLCAICITLTLTPHEQRYLFGILGWKLPDDDGQGEEREKIIRYYMDFCVCDETLTVKECNKKLRTKNYQPLTKRVMRGKR